VPHETLLSRAPPGRRGRVLCIAAVPPPVAMHRRGAS